MSHIYPEYNETMSVREFLARYREAKKAMWKPKARVVHMPSAAPMEPAKPEPVTYTQEQARTFMQQAHVAAASVYREVPEEPFSVKAILVACAEAGKVTTMDLKSARRYKNLTAPRHVFYYLARHHTALSLPQIGSAIGGRDHSTIHHGVNKITAALERGEEKYVTLVAAVLSILRGSK